MSILYEIINKKSKILWSL